MAADTPSQTSAAALLALPPTMFGAITRPVRGTRKGSRSRLEDPLFGCIPALCLLIRNRRTTDLKWPPSRGRLSSGLSNDASISAGIAGPSVTPAPTSSLQHVSAIAWDAWRFVRARACEGSWDDSELQFCQGPNQKWYSSCNDRECAPVLHGGSHCLTGCCSCWEADHG